LPAHEAALVVHKCNECGSKDEDELDAKMKFFSLMTIVRTAKGLHLRIMLMLLAYTVDRFISNFTP
jgi:hypothetical protein